MSGDPRVLAPLQQAFNASDIYHVKRYIAFAWEKETDSANTVIPPIDDRIRAWTPPPTEPSIEQRVAELEQRAHGHDEQYGELEERIRSAEMNIETFMPHLEQHPEPTAPDDPVCAREDCGHPSNHHRDRDGACWHMTEGEDCNCHEFLPAPQPAPDLDPVRVEAALEAIVTQAYLYGSARYSQGVAVVRSRDVGAATDRMLAEWNKLESMIRTIGLGEAS